MDDGPVWRLSSDKWGSHAEHTQGSMVVLQHIIKQHWLLLWWTKLMETREEISAVSDKPLGRSGWQQNANRSTFAGTSAGRARTAILQEKTVHAFSLSIAIHRGAVGQDCWATQETKPLRYFESWSQTNRYDGAFGILLLNFGKRQMPKLGGKISKSSSEWVHQSFEWTFLTEDRCLQSWERENGQLIH